MIEEVFPDIFRMEIPIPENPLRATNSYLVRSKERNLIVDTGIHRPESREAMGSCLKELGVDLNQTDFFITHSHADHLGLFPELRTDSSRIFLNPRDAEFLGDPNHWSKIASVAKVNGFPESILETALRKHPARRYFFKGPLDFDPIREGSGIRAGTYHFLCIETPGHSRGHTCLYEPAAKVLFSGDHVLGSITPNISAYADDSDPLGEYLRSLGKIGQYDIDLVLPGHRNPFRNLPERIKELFEHHETRSRESLSVLSHGRQSAYEVATRMTWDISCGQWADFPVPQKWFATGETLSHLHYLEKRGQVKREFLEGNAFYSLAG
jgi:glyoxylase-like metal-dependent hydrolase (beta-lactamase superfamily II)